MTEPNRIEIDEQLQQESIICKQGIETDFWRLVKHIGANLQDEARNKLVMCDPTNVGEMAQLQAIVKAVDRFVSVIEETAALT